MTIANIEKNDLNFLAIIPLNGDMDYRYAWNINGKSLIRIVFDMTHSVQQIEHTVVVTSTQSNIVKDLLGDDVDVLRIKLIKQERWESIPNLFFISQQVTKKIGKSSSPKNSYDGFIFVDPLYFFLNKSFHLNEAIKLYSSQHGKTRPWCRLISVDPAPNHYHPKKLLKISETGELDYYHKNGKGVFRRQQLDKEIYYRQNRAIFIVDPLIKNCQFYENEKLLCYIIVQPLIKIEREDDINLVNVLNRII